MKNQKDNKFKLEANLLMMLASSMLLIALSAVIILFTLEVQKKFTFSFPKHTTFIDTKGIEEYSIDKLKDKLDFLFSAKTDRELQLFSEKIIFVKKIKTVKPLIIKAMKEEGILGSNVEILQITKIYGKYKKLKGNKNIYIETNSKFRVSFVSKDFKEVKENKYFTMDIIVNSYQQILDFKYYVNDNLKEFYNAIKISKELNLKTLPKYITNKIKNKISVRNLFIKPSGTQYKLEKVEYSKNQIRIIVQIDYKEYSLIYKKGEIINVIKINKK